MTCACGVCESRHHCASLHVIGTPDLRTCPPRRPSAGRCIRILLFLTHAPDALRVASAVSFVNGPSPATLYLLREWHNQHAGAPTRQSVSSSALPGRRRGHVLATRHLRTCRIGRQDPTRSAWHRALPGCVAALGVPGRPANSENHASHGPGVHLPSTLRSSNWNGRTGPAGRTSASQSTTVRLPIRKVLASGS